MSAAFPTAPLLYLTRASKPEQVDSILVDAYRYRHDGLTETKRAAWAEALGTTAEETSQLSSSLTSLLRVILYNGPGTERETLVEVLGTDFHTGLIKLLAKLITSHHTEWREQSMNTLVAPPKLVDFDWRVDTKTSSNMLSRMAVPTVFVNIKTQSVPTQVGSVGAIDSCSFELSKEALQTMLDGLGKIRDQLSGLA